MIRWILLDHEIDDSASERKGGDGVRGIKEPSRQNLVSDKSRAGFISTLPSFKHKQHLPTFLYL